MKIITFEGIEGVGKSTQINLLKDFLIDRGLTVDIVREPGSTTSGEAIRNILLSNDYELNSKTELLLMFSARSELIKNLDSSNKHDVILFDRFYHASVAYQGHGRGIDLDFIHSLINFIDCPKPDLTFILDNSVENSFNRKSSDVKDRIERSGESFFNKVRDGYLAIASENKDYIKVIDASNDIDFINKSIINYVLEIL